MSELEPLSNDLADLFEQEKRATHDDPALRANVFHGVQLAIALAPSLPPAAPVAAKTATAAKSWLASVVAKSAVVKAGVVVIALGGGTAAVVATQHASPSVVATRPAVVQTVSPISASPPRTTNEFGSAPIALPDPVPATESPAANAPPMLPAVPSKQAVPAPATEVVAAAAPSSRALSREHALIDAARAALSSGDAGGAIASLSEHAKLWPHGALVEEREALWIKALAKEGRKSDATDRAARFRKSFPNSILLPVVESAVAN